MTVLTKADLVAMKNAEATAEKTTADRTQADKLIAGALAAAGPTRNNIQVSFPNDNGQIDAALAAACDGTGVSIAEPLTDVTYLTKLVVLIWA